MSADDGGDDGEGSKPFICGQPCRTKDERCQYPVETPDGRCPNHPKDGSGPPEGSGSGSPDHRMGDGDGKIQERLPDGAKPGMRHGVHAVQDDPRGTLRWVEENDPRGYDWILAKWESYMADAPFGKNTSKADDILEVALMKYAIRGMRDQQVRVGLTQQMQTTTETGAVVDIEQELPGNLPANRLAREARSILRENGLVDDPQSKKAQAMGWGAAAKEVAQEIDSEVEDADGGQP